MDGDETGTPRQAAQVASMRAELESFRSLFHAMGQGYCELELVRDGSGAAVDQRYIEFNPSFERIFGIPVAAARGRLATEIFPTLDPWWHQAFGRVVQRGEPQRLEHPISAGDRWFEVFAYPKGGDRVIAMFEDITDRKRSEAVSRESEERLSFMLALGDAMRSQTSADGVVQTAAKLLGLKLKASRVVFGEFDDEHDLVHIRRGWTADGAETHPAALRQSDFLGPLLDELRANAIVRLSDVGEPPYLRPDLEALASIGVKAALSVPLLIDGRLMLNLMVHNHAPYQWSDAEVLLAQETAARTWAALQRARAEAALRESEQRFQQFAKASAAGLWIRDGKSLEMEFVSPAVEAIYGTKAGDLLGDVRKWAALIVPEDRDSALKHLEAAQPGATAQHEFRIQRSSDGAFRWLRNTDFPLSDDGHIARVGGIVDDITETRQLVEHQGVLLAELQHRVRNIMGMIRSMANRTASGAKDIDDYRELLEGRLLALSRVQALLTRQANAGGSLRAIVHEELAAQAHDNGQFELVGPDTMLAPKAVEVLTLAFHELATTRSNMAPSPFQRVVWR